MKAGDIVRIDGNIYEFVNTNSYLCDCSNCPFSINDYDCGRNDGLCPKPIELTYGRWYKCSDVMPEDFKELLYDSDMSKSVVVNNKYGDDPFVAFRVNKKGIWIWAEEVDINNISAITHWMAIPPLDK